MDRHEKESLGRHERWAGLCVARRRCPAVQARADRGAAARRLLAASDADSDGPGLPLPPPAHKNGGPGANLGSGAGPHGLQSRGAARGRLGAGRSRLTLLAPRPVRSTAWPGALWLLAWGSHSCPRQQPQLPTWQPQLPTWQPLWPVAARRCGCAAT